MGFLSDLKANFKNVKPKVKKDIVNSVRIELDRGQNHMFTKSSILTIDKDGQVFLNHQHKIKIVTCSEYHEVEVGKSVSKKIAGAAVGGLLGGAGAVVGAVAVGNNKKKISKFNKLIAIDENEYVHEVIIKSAFFQREMINSIFVK